LHYAESALSVLQREAFNHLLYGIRERKGFVQLTGEVGAGKTTLCRAMLEQFGDKFSELAHYIQHRLHVSGSPGGPSFTLPALWRIQQYSQGVPRLVNAICDKCLLAGFVQQRERINFQMIGLAVRELEGAIYA
jgi:type II secretory pathway predicted ATPase ExeA